MAYKQVRNFNLSSMGKRAGWCLMNCRLGFGISKGTYPSAKADMESQRKNGTLHGIDSVPTNCAVPVYADTSSKYEHVLVCDHGVYYSDGKRLAGTGGFKFFGWGELCDGKRVVEWTNDPVVTPDLPPRGYIRLGDNLPIVGRIAIFMRKNYPAYTSEKALGTYYGNYICSSIKEFQRRTGLQPDGNIGPITLAKLKAYGFGG